MNMDHDHGITAARYFVKAPISGWHEVDKEHYNRFVRHLREHATPPSMTIDELIRNRARIEECHGWGPCNGIDMLSE